jgi:hypothetical protein
MTSTKAVQLPQLEDATWKCGYAGSSHVQSLELPEATYGIRQTCNPASSQREEPEARDKLRYLGEFFICYTFAALQIEHPELLHIATDEVCLE